jgi:hypothetical protein
MGLPFLTQSYPFRRVTLLIFYHHLLIGKGLLLMVDRHLPIVYIVIGDE